MALKVLETFLNFFFLTCTNPSCMLFRLKVCQCMVSISAALLQECLDPVGLERISTLKEDGRRMHVDAFQSVS